MATVEYLLQKAASLPQPVPTPETHFIDPQPDEDLAQFEADNKLEMRVRSLVGMELKLDQDKTNNSLRACYEGSKRSFYAELEGLAKRDMLSDEPVYWRLRVEKVKQAKLYGGIR